jgi:hypothetical protein
VPGVVENLKIISKTASDNITKYAFEYAVANSNVVVMKIEEA